MSFYLKLLMIKTEFPAKTDNKFAKKFNYYKYWSEIMRVRRSNCIDT